MKPASELELAHAPTITLAGVAYKVPKLVARQNRVVTPRVLGIFDVFVRITVATQNENLLGITLSEKQFDDMLDIAHAAIMRVAPEIKRTDLDDWEITTLELFAMLPVVAAQAGLTPERVVTPPLPLTPGLIPADTAQPEAQPSQPTGTELQSKSQSEPAGS